MTFIEDNGRVYVSAEPMPWGMVEVDLPFVAPSRPNPYAANRFKPYPWPVTFSEEV